MHVPCANLEEGGLHVPCRSNPTTTAASAAVYLSVWDRLGGGYNQLWRLPRDDKPLKGVDFDAMLRRCCARYGFSPPPEVCLLLAFLPLGRTVCCGGDWRDDYNYSAMWGVFQRLSRSRTEVHRPDVPTDPGRNPVLWLAPSSLHNLRFDFWLYVNFLSPLCG